MSCKIYRFTQQRQNVMILVHYLRKRCTGVLRPEIFLQAGLHQISGLFGYGIIMMLWQKVFCGDQQKVRGNV